MTSKECLSDLYFLAIGDENHTKKCKEIIEKDLEVLDCFKKLINKNWKILSNIKLDIHLMKILGWLLVIAI